MPDTPAGLDRFSLHGRGVVLTGGGGHLGCEMALAIAGAGGTTVIVGRRESALEAAVERARSEGLANAVIPCAGDVGDPATFGRAMDSLRERELRLDGCVNNAYAGTAAPLGELDRSAVEDTLRAGLTDAMLLADLAGREMASQGDGAIVNVASMYGLVSPRPEVYADAPDLHNPPAYGAAKAGLLQFTRYAAVHWARSGVRVNALTPGAFPSPEVQERADFVAALEAQVPMGRIGRAEEIGGALVFLLSPASSYMTGQQVIVDGGWTAW